MLRAYEGGSQFRGWPAYGCYPMTLIKGVSRTMARAAIRFRCVQIAAATATGAFLACILRGAGEGKRHRSLTLSLY